MKKLISTLLAIIMLVFTTFPAFASENTAFLQPPKTVDEVSELLDNLDNTQILVSSEKTMIDNMLKNNAITRRELNEQLTTLSQRSELDLRNEGYNEKQIGIIKSYEDGEDAYEHVFGTKNKASRADATVEFRYGLAGSNTRKDIGIAYDMTWSSCPFFTFTDSFGIGWIAADSNSYEVITKINSSTGEIRFATTDESYTGEYRDVSMNTSSSNVVTGNPVIGSAGGSYGKRIGGYTQISTQSNSYNIDTIHVFFAYAHTTIKPTASASVTIGWKKLDGTIAFSANASQELIVSGDHTFRYSDQGEIVA